MRYLDVIESRVEKRFIVCFHGSGKTLFSSIKAGLSWPTPNSPGYYVVLGEEYRAPGRFDEEQKTEKGKLILLADRESRSPFPDKLFDPLTDDCTLFRCDSIYTDLKNYEGDVSVFRDWIYQKDIRVNLIKGPFCEGFGLGVSLIRRWMDEGLLELPEGSATREQLKKLTASDFEESPEIRFHAINALRFVVGAFEKYRPIHINFNRRRTNNLGPNAWMVR